MRDAARNLSHILISRRDEDLVPAFTIGETTYLVYPKVPATAIVRLTTGGSNVAGMQDYVMSCLAKPEQRDEFITLMDNIDVEGLGEIIEEIVSITTPFDGKKPNG